LAFRCIQYNSIIQEKGYNIIATAVPTNLMSELLVDRIACIQDSVTAETNTRQSAAVALAKPKEKRSEQAEDFSSQVHIGAVRSGQQIYAQGKSLVILGNVNSGAEIMADGDVYVFGRLMGRAVAGLGGGGSMTSPSRCSIYTTHFAASLVGIQSIFVAPDDYRKSRDMIGKSVRISLCPSQVASGDSVIVNVDSNDGNVGMMFTPL
jgi:septum site-determining protein MinC